MRAWSNKRRARATETGERGRDGPELWGTAGKATSRKQTHGVGNQAMSALRNKLTAWRNQAERASWEESVERETERQARRDKLDSRATERREGREDEIIVYESNTVRKVDETRAAERATVRLNDREEKIDFAGNRGMENKSRTKSSQGNGR